MRITVPARAAAVFVACLTLGSPLALSQARPPETGAIVEAMRAEAAKLREFVTSDAARLYLDALESLPPIEPRPFYYNRETRALITPAEFESLDESEQEGFSKTQLGERYYYQTRYGSPAAYARAFDIAGAHGFRPDGAKVLDFGVGGVAPLRILASLGAEAHGVDVDKTLQTVFSHDHDQGEVERISAAGEGEPGSAHLHIGQWPADQAIVGDIGGGVDLFISKNTLKRGYIHPEREANPAHLVHLGVDDAAFLRSLHDTLAPGGLVVIYNLYPRPRRDDEPYIPWASGECPFDQDEIEAAGLEILEYDIDDTSKAREMATLLGWDAQMNLEEDLFGMYTVLRKR